MSYEHILLVTDLMSDADVVAQKAKRIVENRPNAKLSVLHIVKDTMVGFGYELVPASSYTMKSMMNAAKKRAPNWLSFWSVMTCTRSTLK